MQAGGDVASYHKHNMTKTHEQRTHRSNNILKRLTPARRLWSDNCVSFSATHDGRRVTRGGLSYQCASIGYSVPHYLMEIRLRLEPIIVLTVECKRWLTSMALPWLLVRSGRHRLSCIDS